MPPGNKANNNSNNNNNNNKIISSTEDYYLLEESAQREVGYVPIPTPIGCISRHFRTQLVWDKILFYITLHILAFCGLLVASTAKLSTWVFMTTLFVTCLLGVTAGAHRLWAHKSYKAHAVYRFCLVIMQTIAIQHSVIEWARDHRTHHKFSETDADPHNAKRGFFFAHMGWLMCRKHPEVIKKGKLVDMSDLKNDPILAFQHRYFKLLVLLLSNILPVVTNLLLCDEAFINSILICVPLRYAWTLHSTWLVNSAAHMWGAHPYDKHISPAENIIVTFSALGEGFHNYHHCFPYDYATSEFGPIFNATTCFIDMAAAFGLVWDRKRATHTSVDARKARTGDGL